MAWTSRFSGLPTQTDIPFMFPPDTYVGGVFTVQAGGRDFPSGTAPIAYETLAGMGASILSVLRVTARITGILGGYYALGGGPVLYGPDRTDQLYGQVNGNGFWEAGVVENGSWASIGGVSDAGATVWQIRHYWNGTASPFTIPDAGFGSHVVAANAQSVWYSKDDGSTWTNLGDRAIASGVAPTRAGFGAINTNTFDTTPRTVTFSSLEVMEEASPNPYLDNQSPGSGGIVTDPDTLISVDIKDPENDIDLTTLNVTVDSGGGPVAAYTAGVGFVAPYNGPSSSLTPIANGYTLVLDNTASFPAGSVETRVVVQDLAAHPLDDSWTFDVTFLVDNTLWALGASGKQLWHSFDQGSTWVQVDTSGLSNWLNGLWGPTTSWKVYVGVADDGTYYYDGTWHLEDANGPWWNAVTSRPDDQTIWCSDDDSLVCAAGWSSTYHNVIRTRPGSPGTPWVTEYDDGAGDGYFNDIHGAPDGSAVFAIRSYVGINNDVQLLKRASGGTWSVVASITDGDVVRWQQVRVISDTEVWITGSYQVGGTDLVGRIWKWNGSSLSIEYEDTDIRYNGIVGLWMAKDGSEGWALFEVDGPAPIYATDYYLHYNGTAWSVAQGAQYGVTSGDITQRDGVSASAIALFVRSDLRKYDGAIWDDTYNYSYPNPGNVIWNWTTAGVALILRYLEYSPAPPYTNHDKTLISEGTVWADRNPTPPSSAFSFGLTDSPPRTAYDPFQGKVYLVGYDTTHRFFRYDLATSVWTAITLSGTPGTNFPAMDGDALKIAFDSQHRQLLVFVSSPAALWIWNPTDGWAKPTLTGDSIASMRGYESQIVYDPFRLGLWVIGRPLGGGADPLLYLIDLATLVVSELSSPSGVPGTDYPDFTDRQGFGAAYDPVSHALLVSHGGDTTIPTLYADTWAFDGMWANVTPGGIEGANYPEARSLCLMAVGVDDQLVHLVGGVSDAETFGDEWIWNGVYWSKQAVSGSGVAYLGFNMGGTGHAR